MPTDAIHAPTGLHVGVLPSGRRSPVRQADTWTSCRLLYGKAYAWAEPTAEELADYYAEHARIAAMQTTPPGADR